MKRALRFGSDTHNIEDLVGCLQRGEMQAFSNDRAIVCTMLVESPQRRYLDVFLGAGEMDALVDLFPQVQQWAIDHGAEFGRVMVRPGLARVLEQHGWERKKTVVMEFHPTKGQ